MFIYKSFQEELCQLVLVLPDVTIIGREPAGKQGLEEMKLLLLLLLGCAVQCPNKQGFIEKIKALPLSAQHSLVNFILQVHLFLFIIFTAFEKATLK